MLLQMENLKEGYLMSADRDYFDIKIITGLNLLCLFHFLDLEAHIWICFSIMSENTKSGIFLGNSTFEDIYLG